MRNGVVPCAVLAVVAFLAPSCASMTQTEAWTGRRIDEAIAKLGTPSHVTSGENGQKTYLWMLHRSVPEQLITYDGFGTPRTVTRSRDSVHTWMFVVGADGIIITWTHDPDLGAGQRLMMP